MTSNHDGFIPTDNQPWNVFTNDGLSEHCPTKDVTDRPIGRLPHLLQVEL